MHCQPWHLVVAFGAAPVRNLAYRLHAPFFFLFCSFLPSTMTLIHPLLDLFLCAVVLLLTIRLLLFRTQACPDGVPPYCHAVDTEVGISRIT